ncbi:hypothetical protein HMPREF3291_21525 [Bacillus sp. HMSC76G11]|nr:hypothetical protein HMPREF3291_21525 [Bacillus sp. HMSC76G11]
MFSIINVVRSFPLQELAFRGERRSLLGEPAGSSISLYFPAGSSSFRCNPLRFTTFSLKRKMFTERAFKKRTAKSGS